jgi:hypothetical protein
MCVFNTDKGHPEKGQEKDEASLTRFNATELVFLPKIWAIPESKHYLLKKLLTEFWPRTSSEFLPSHFI